MFGSVEGDPVSVDIPTVVVIKPVVVATFVVVVIGIEGVAENMVLFPKEIDFFSFKEWTHWDYVVEDIFSWISKSKASSDGFYC